MAGVKLSPNNTNQLLEIEMEETLQVGNLYSVYIEFKSRIAPAVERMNGLYLSTYMNGTQRK